MDSKQHAYANAEMMIRKPINEVFEAFIDPAITTKFWFTKSSGRLEAGKQIAWTWEMYNVTVLVDVKAIVTNQSIVIEWGNGPQRSRVEWTFREIAPAKTYVTIVNDGFSGTSEQLIAQIRDSTAGFNLLIAGLKAYLEHGIQLNLVADKHPKDVGDGEKA